MVNIYRGTSKNSYNIKDLLDIVHILRAPGGCPWDRRQDHRSIRGAIVEEAYEAADAIDRADMDGLCEELGDVLLQVVFHSDLAAASGGFDFSKVVDGICKKLIYRHPHVFSDAKADTPDEVMDNWDTLKRAEKGQDTAAQTLRSVPKAFPALMRAEKVQKRASKAGFDWDEPSGAFAKLSEETAELGAAVQSGVQTDIEDELGDLLFSAVNVARFLHTEPEAALDRATEKFIGRFEQAEKLALERGIDLKSADLETLDSLWEEAKSLL